MRHALRVLIAAALTVSAFACSAADTSAKFEEGKQYKKVSEVQAPADKSRIEVAEFFWYGCPHCYAFDPSLRAWEKSKPADVDFVRYPNSLGHPQGLLHSRAFYTAMALGVFDTMHVALFDAIHKDGNPLSSEAQIAALFKKDAGVDANKFSGTFDGFVVDAQVRKAEDLSRSYGIYSVPTIVVGGKYATGPAMTGGLEQTIAAINFLVDKVRKERGNKK